MIAVLVLAVPLAAPAAVLPATPSALESQPTGWVDILPGPGLSGWKRFPIKSELRPQLEVWRVDRKVGVLGCLAHLPPAPAGGKDGSHEMLRYDKELSDFVFHVEWRFVDSARAGWNSGVFARVAPDRTVWYQAQMGNAAGGFWFGDLPDATGKVTRQKLVPREVRVKPAGEWNTFEITARGDRLVLWVNGAVTSEWSGITLTRGHLGLEAEFHHVEFRNLKLKELPR
jgi:hypothetical protein